MFERHVFGILIYLWILYLDGCSAQKSCLPHALSLRRLETFPVAKESSATTIIKSDYGFFLCLAKSMTDDFSTIVCRHVDTQDMQQSDESFEEVAEVEGNIVDFQVSTRKSSSLLMAVMKDRLNVLFVVETNGSYMGLTALGPIGVMGADSTRLVQNRDRIAILSSSSRACKELEHDCNVPQVEIIAGNELSRCISSDFGSSVAVTGWPFGQYFYIVHALKDAANSRKNHLKIFRLDNGADPSNCHLEGLETLQLSKTMCDVRSLKLFRASGMYFLLVGSDDCDSPRSRIGETSRNIIAMQWSPITGLLDPETITELQNTNNVRSLMSLSASIFLLDRADSDSSIHCLTADILSDHRQTDGADDPVAQLSALNTVATVPALSSSSKFAALNNNDGQIYLARLFDDVDSRSVELNRLACENFGRQSGSDFAAQTLEYEPDQSNISHALTSTFSSVLGDISDFDGPSVGVIATWLGDFHDYEDAVPLVILGNNSEHRLQEAAEDEYEEATTPSWYTLPVVYPQMVPPGYFPAQSAPAYAIPGYGGFNASFLRLQQAYGHPVITVPVLQPGNGQGGIRYEKFIKTRPHAPVTPPGINYASRFLRVRPSRNSTNTSGTFIKVLTSTLWSTPRQPATVPPAQTALETAASAHQKRLLYSDDVQRIRYSNGSKYEDEGFGGEAPFSLGSGPSGLRLEDADDLTLGNEIPIELNSLPIRYDNSTSDEANMLPAAAYGPVPPLPGVLIAASFNQRRLMYGEEPMNRPLGINYENRSIEDIEAMPKPLPAYGFARIPKTYGVRYDNGSVDGIDMEQEVLPIHDSDVDSNGNGEQIPYRPLLVLDVSGGYVEGIRYENDSEARGIRFNDTSYPAVYDAVARLPASVPANFTTGLSSAAAQRKGKPLRWDDKYGINYRDTETADTGFEAATMTTVISGDGVQHLLPGTPRNFLPETGLAFNQSMYGADRGYEAWPSISPVRYDDGALTYGEGIRYNRSEAATMTTVISGDGLQHFMPVPVDLQSQASQAINTSMRHANNGLNEWPFIPPVRYDDGALSYGEGIRYNNKSDAYATYVKIPQRDYIPTEYLIALQPAVSYSLPSPLVQEFSAPVQMNGSSRVRYDQKRVGKKRKRIRYTNESIVDRPRAVVPKRERSPRLFYLNGTEYTRHVAEIVTVPSAYYRTPYGIRYGNDTSSEEAKKGIRSSTADSEITPARGQKKIKQKAVARRAKSLAKDGLHYENSTAVTLPGGGILYAEKSMAWSPNEQSQSVSSTQVSAKKKTISRKKYPQATLKRRPANNQTKTGINATSTNSSIDGVKFEEYYANKTKPVSVTSPPTNKSETQLTLTPEIVVTSPWQPTGRLRGVRYGDNFMANLSDFSVNREDYPTLRRVRFTQTDAKPLRMADISPGRYEPTYGMQAPSLAASSPPHGKPIRYNDTYGISAVYGSNVLYNDSAGPLEVGVAGPPSYVPRSPIRYNNVTDQDVGYEDMRPLQVGISSGDQLDTDYVETKDSPVVVVPGAQRLYNNRTLQSHTVNVMDYDETTSPTFDLGHIPANGGIGMQYFTPTWLAADVALPFGVQDTGIAYPIPLPVRLRQDVPSPDYEESRRVIDDDMDYDENPGPYGLKKASGSNQRLRYNETLRNGTLAFDDGLRATAPRAPLPPSGSSPEVTQQAPGVKYDDGLPQTAVEDTQPPVHLPLVSRSRYNNSVTKEEYWDVPVVHPVGVFPPPDADVRMYGADWERPSSNRFFADRYNSTQDELARYPTEFPAYTDAHVSGVKEASSAQYYGSDMTKVPRAYAENYNVSLSDADYPEHPSVVQHNQFEILPIPTVLPLREPFTRQFEGKPRRPFKRRYNESKDETDLLIKTPFNVQAVPFVLPARKTYNQSLENHDYDELPAYRMTESVAPFPPFPAHASVVLDGTALVYQSSERAFGYPYNYTDAVQHAEQNPASVLAVKHNSSLNDEDYSETLRTVKPSYVNTFPLPALSPDQQTTVSRWETAPRRPFKRRYNVSRDELELAEKLVTKVQPATSSAILSVRPRTTYNQSLCVHDYDELMVFRSEDAIRFEAPQLVAASFPVFDGLAAPLQTPERVFGFAYNHSNLLYSDATGAFERKYNFSLMDEDYAELERIPVAHLPLPGTPRMDKGTAPKNRAKSERPAGLRPFKSRYNKTKAKTVRPSSTTTRKPDLSIQPAPQPVDSAYQFLYGERPDLIQQFRARYNESVREYVLEPKIVPQMPPVYRPPVSFGGFPVMEPLDGRWERPESQRPFLGRHNISTDAMPGQQPLLNVPGQLERALDGTLQIPFSDQLSPPLGFYPVTAEHVDGRWERPDGARPFSSRYNISAEAASKQQEPPIRLAESQSVSVGGFPVFLGEGRWERPDGVRAFPSRYNSSIEISSVHEQLLGGHSQYEPMHNRTLLTYPVGQPPFPVDGFPVWMEAKWERPDSTRPFSSRYNTSTETTPTERHLYREPQHGTVQHEALQTQAADRAVSVSERLILEPSKQIWERPDGNRQFLERYNTSTETTPVEQYPFAGSGDHELPFNRMPRMFSVDQGELPAIEITDGRWERPDVARQFLGRYNTSTERTPVQQQPFPSQQKPVRDSVLQSVSIVGGQPFQLGEMPEMQTTDGKAERSHGARLFSGRYNTSTETTPAQQKPLVWETQYEPAYNAPGGSVVHYPSGAFLPGPAWHGERPASNRSFTNRYNTSEPLVILQNQYELSHPHPDRAGPSIPAFAYPHPVDLPATPFPWYAERLNGSRPFLGRYNASADMTSAEERPFVWPGQYEPVSSHAGASLVPYPGGPSMHGPAFLAERPYGNSSFVSRYSISEPTGVQQSQYDPVQRQPVPTQLKPYAFPSLWYAERPDGSRAFSSRYNSTDAFLDTILAAQQGRLTVPVEHPQFAMDVQHPGYFQTAGPVHYGERPEGVQTFSSRYNLTEAAAHEAGLSVLPGEPLVQLAPFFGPQLLQLEVNRSLQGVSPYHERSESTRAFVRRYNHSEGFITDAPFLQQEQPNAEFVHPGVDLLLPAPVGETVWERPDGSRPFSGRYNATELISLHPPSQQNFATSPFYPLIYSSAHLPSHAPAYHTWEKPDGARPFSTRYNTSKTLEELLSQYQQHQLQVPFSAATYGYLQSLPDTETGERIHGSRPFSSRYNNSAEIATVMAWPARAQPVSSHTGATLVANPGEPSIPSPALHGERPYGNRSFVGRYNISEPLSVQRSQYGPVQHHPLLAQIGIPHPVEPYASALPWHERPDGNRPFSSRYNAAELPALSPLQQAPPALLGINYPHPDLIFHPPVEQYDLRHGEQPEKRQHFSARYNHSDASGLVQEHRPAIPEIIPFPVGVTPLTHPEGPGSERRFGERPDGKQQFPARYNTNGAFLAPHDFRLVVHERPALAGANLFAGSLLVDTAVTGHGAFQGERPESGRPFATRYNHTEDTPTYVRPYRAEADKVVFQPELAYQREVYSPAMHSRPDGYRPFAVRYNGSEESRETAPLRDSAFVPEPYHNASAPFQASARFHTWEKPDGFRALHNESAQYPSAPSQYPAQLSALPGLLRYPVEVYEDRTGRGERPEGKRPFSSRFNGTDVLVMPAPQQASMGMDLSQRGMVAQYPPFDFVQHHAQYGERPDGRQQFSIRFNHTDSDVEPHEVPHVGLQTPFFSEVVPGLVIPLAPEPTSYQPWFGERPDGRRSFVSRFNHTGAIPTDMRLFQGEAAQHAPHSGVVVQYPVFDLAQKTAQYGERPDGRQQFLTRFNNTDEASLSQHEVQLGAHTFSGIIPVSLSPVAFPDLIAYQPLYGERPEGDRPFMNRFNHTGAIPTDMRPFQEEAAQLVPQLMFPNPDPSSAMHTVQNRWQRPDGPRPFGVRYNSSEQTLVIQPLSQTNSAPPSYQNVSVLASMHTFAPYGIWEKPDALRPFSVRYNSSDEYHSSSGQPGLPVQPSHSAEPYGAPSYWTGELPDGTRPYNAAEGNPETAPPRYTGFVSSSYHNASAPLQVSARAGEWENPDGFRAFPSRYNQSAKYVAGPRHLGLSPAQLTVRPSPVDVYGDRPGHGESPEEKRPFSSRYNVTDIAVMLSSPLIPGTPVGMDHSQSEVIAQYPIFDLMQNTVRYGERPDGRQQFFARFNNTDDASLQQHEVRSVQPAFPGTVPGTVSLSVSPVAFFELNPYRPWHGERPDGSRPVVDRFDHTGALPTDMRLFQGEAAQPVLQPIVSNSTLGLSMHTVQNRRERPDGPRRFGVRYDASEQTLVIQPVNRTSFAPVLHQNASTPFHGSTSYGMWERPDDPRPFSARYNASDEYLSTRQRGNFTLDRSYWASPYGVPSYWTGERPDGTRPFSSRYNLKHEGVSGLLTISQAGPAPVVVGYPAPLMEHLMPSAEVQPGFFGMNGSVYGSTYGERPYGMRPFSTRFNHTDADGVPQEVPSVYERVPFGGLVPAPVTSLVQPEMDRFFQSVPQYGERPQASRTFVGRYNQSEAISTDTQPPQQQDDQLLPQSHVVSQDLHIVASMHMARDIWERPYGFRPYVVRYNATAPASVKQPVQQLISVEPSSYPMSHPSAREVLQMPIPFDSWERPDGSRAFSSRYNQTEQLPLVRLPAGVGVSSYGPQEIPSQRRRPNSTLSEDHFDVPAEMQPQQGQQFAHSALEDAFLNWGPVMPAQPHLSFDMGIPLWERPDGSRPFVSRFNHTERREMPSQMVVYPVQLQPQNHSFLQAEPQAAIPQEDKTSFVPVRIIAEKPDEVRPFKIRYNQTHILDIPDAFVEPLSRAVGQGLHLSYVPPQNLLPEATPSTHQAERPNGSRSFAGRYNQTDMHTEPQHEFQQGLLQITSVRRPEYLVSQHVQPSFVPETWAAAHGPERPDGPRPFVGRFNRTEITLVHAQAELSPEGHHQVFEPSRSTLRGVLPQMPVDAHKDLGWSRPERPDGTRPFVSRFDLPAVPSVGAQPDSSPREPLRASYVQYPDPEVPQMVQPGWLEMSVPDSGRPERPDGVRPFVGRFNRTEISPVHIPAEQFTQWQYPIVNLSQMVQPEPVAEMPISVSSDLDSSKAEKPDGIRPFVSRFDRTAALSLESQPASSRQELLHIPSVQHSKEMITQNVQHSLMPVPVSDSHRAERPDGVRLFVNRYNLSEIRPIEIQPDVSQQGVIHVIPLQHEDMKSTEVSVTFQPQFQMPSMMPTPGAERPDGKQSFSSRYNRTSPEKPHFRGFVGKYNESLPVVSYTKTAARPTPKPVIKLTRPTVTLVTDVGERPSGSRKFAGRYNVTETEVQNKSIVPVKKQTKLPKKAAFRQRYNKTLPEGEHEEITAAATSLPVSTAYDFPRLGTQKPPMDIFSLWPSEEIPPTAPQYEHRLVVGERPGGSRVYVTRYNGTEAERRDRLVMPVDQTLPPVVVAVRHQYNKTLPEEDHEEIFFVTTAMPASTAYSSSRVSSRAPVPLLPAERHQGVQISLYENGTAVGERAMDGAFSHRYNQSRVVEEPFQIHAPAQSGFVPRYDLSVLAEDYEDRAILTSTNRTQLYPLTDEHVQSEVGRPAIETPLLAEPLPVVPPPQVTLREPGFYEAQSSERHAQDWSSSLLVDSTSSALERKSVQQPILVAVPPTQIIATQYQEPVPEIYQPAQYWPVPVMHPYSEVVRGVDPNRYGIVRNATGDMLFEEDTTIAFREDERRMPYQPSVQVPLQLEPSHFLPGPLSGLFQPEMQPMFVNGSLMRRVEDQRFTPIEHPLGGTFEMQPPVPWQTMPHRNDTLSPPMPPPQLYMPVPHAAPHMPRAAFQQGRVPQSLLSQGQAGPSSSGRQGKKFKTDVSLLRPLMPPVSGSQHTGIQADIRSPSYALPTRKTFKRLPTTPVDWTRSTTRVTAKTTLPPSNPNIPRLKKILYGKPNGFMQGLGSSAQTFNQPQWNFTAQPQHQYPQPDTRYDLRSPLSHVAPLSAYAARPVPALPSNNITSQFFGTNQTQTGCCGNSRVGDGSVIDILINKSGVRSLLDSVKINMSASTSRDETTSYSVKLQLVQLPAVSLDSICSTPMTVEAQKTKKEVDCSAKDISEAGVGIGVKSGSGSFHYEILNTADSLKNLRVLDELKQILESKTLIAKFLPTKTSIDFPPKSSVKVLRGVDHVVNSNSRTGMLDGSRFVVDESNGYLYPKVPFRRNAPTKNRFYVGPNKAYNVLVQVTDTICDTTETAKLTITFVCTSSRTESPSYKTTQN